MSKRFYWKKLRPIVISVVVCCIFFLILMAITSNRNGDLTIYVDRSSVTKSLSLSESSTLSNPKGKIYGPSLSNAWDTRMCEEEEDPTAVSCVPTNTYLLDGNNSGKHYISYTFYVFNSGIENLDYSMSFNIENTSKNLDEVVRVNLYVNNSLTTYAKKSNISGEAELGTTAFESNDVIVSGTVTDLEPNEAVKYTIVLWVDGYDEECKNDKIGGSITLSMRFSVLGIV